MRRAAKVDANQAEIVDALRRVGASVQPLHAVGAGVPDLLVGYRFANYLLECKRDEKAKLTDRQVRWHEVWRGSVLTVTSPEDAIEQLGISTVGKAATSPTNHSNGKETLP